MALKGKYSFLESPIRKLWMPRVFLSPPKLLMKESDDQGVTSRYLCLHPDDQHVAHLPVIQIPWAFKCKEMLRAAWMGKALPSLVILGGGLVFSKLLFLLLQLLWLLSPEDLMF